jgi:RNA polymerase sigma-70 factor, ECF subfamily
VAIALTSPARRDLDAAPGVTHPLGARLVPDEALLEQFRQGEAGAFRALVGRYAGEILSYATRLVGDRTWAEDLTQEVFVKLSTRPPTNPTNGLRPWLYAVAKNQCLDFLKKRERRVEPLVTDAMPCPRPGPEAATENVELRERVTRTLDSLPDEQREAFVLCVLQGLSYEDAASVAGCSVKTLSSRLARARERFRLEVLS